MSYAALPAISQHDPGLAQYMAAVRQFPVLSADEEFMLAKRMHVHQDQSAARQLITSHLRLVVKIAGQYRGYGLPFGELVAEGNIGLMQAVKKYDPDKGYRLATYAMWWIHAALKEFVMKSWSLVKIGTTAAQKRLFFNLRRLKNLMPRLEQGYLSKEQVESVAKELGVSDTEVMEMDQRLSQRDFSIHAPVQHDSTTEWSDWLVDTHTPSPETLAIEDNHHHHQRRQVAQALSQLNAREQRIIRARHMSDDPLSLEVLSQELGISRERVRQIEAKAMEKIQQFFTAQNFTPLTATVVS